MPTLPSSLDKDPEAVQPLANDELGEITTKHTELVSQYGVLGVRYQSLRAYYKCVLRQMNEHKTTEGCL